MEIGLTNNGWGFEFLNPKERRRIIRFLSVYLTILFSVIVIPESLIAASEKPLTDLFETTAFSGSWEVFTKFNWLGGGLNFLISIFCLIGIILVAIQFTVTILYKSNESIFDRVYELKGKGKGQSFAGVPAMFKELKNGNFGIGADVVLGFFLSLCPNVKEYSYYNPEKQAFNLEENDTVTTFILKMSIPTIMTIFFFSMGFNGTLWKAYGNVVDAMSVAASNVCDVNLAQFVDNAMNSELYYNFSYNTKTEWGSFKKKLASSIYTKTLAKTVATTDKATYQNMGAVIQKAVDSIGADNIAAQTEALYTGQWTSLLVSESASSSSQNNVKGNSDNISGDSTDVNYTANASINDEVAGHLDSHVVVNTSFDSGADNTVSGNGTLNDPNSGVKDGMLTLCWGLRSDGNNGFTISTKPNEGDCKYYVHITISRDGKENMINYFDAVGKDDTSSKVENTETSEDKPTGSK